VSEAQGKLPAPDPGSFRRQDFSSNQRQQQQQQQPVWMDEVTQLLPILLAVIGNLVSYLPLNKHLFNGLPK